MKNKRYCYEVIDHKEVKIFKESDPMLASTYSQFNEPEELYRDLVSFGWDEDTARQAIFDKCFLG